LIIWAEKSSPHVIRRLSAILACLAKNGHLSSVVIVKLDRLVLPALDRHQDHFTIKDLFEEGFVQSRVSPASPRSLA